MAGPLETFAVDVTGAVEPDGGPVRIIVEGELDGAAGPRLIEAVEAGMASGQPAELTVDLSRLRFIDSGGLRALIQIEREAERRQLRLVVVPAPEPIIELLQVAGVARRLRLAEGGPMLPGEPDFLERSDTELRADNDAPARARAAVREILEGMVERSELTGIVLMTSELVTNAVVHGAAGQASSARSSTVGLSVVRFPDHLRVEVDDPGRGFDPAQHGPDGAGLPGPGEGGRGLFVVDRTAVRWGTRSHETDRGWRFSVWFETGIG
jgi:anti-sigma B factor antagonist